MKTPYELFGYEVGPGWMKIVRPLVDQANAEGATILQIKEKFGGLRFYVGGASEELLEAIDRAEEESYKTCEVCGEPGVPRRGGWIRTLCDGCNDK